MTIKLIPILILLFSLNAKAQIKMPDGFEKLLESPANGKKISDIVFDFDGDGQNDYATIVFETNHNTSYYVMLYLSKKDEYKFVKMTGFDSDFSVYPSQLKLKKNILEYAYFFDGTAAFGRFIKLRYDNKSAKFRVIGYDSGYRLVGGHCDKSYNLLTGNFVVRNELSNPVKRVDVHKGKKSISSQYIDDLNDSLFNVLDAVGNEYEIEQ